MYQEQQVERSRLDSKQPNQPYSNMQAIPGVPKIKEGYNPATWMLEVSSSAAEIQLDVDFAQILANSELHR